jgi:hypothetical protein
MKTVKLIVSTIILAAMFFSFTGEVLHVHYCSSSNTYSFDLDHSSDSDCSPRNCLCHVSGEENVTAPSTNSCCSSKLEDNPEGICCIDLKTSPDPDTFYSSVVINLDLKPTVLEIFNFPVASTTLLSTLFYYDFHKTGDHSPPEIISTQVLLI